MNFKQGVSSVAVAILLAQWSAPALAQDDAPSVGAGEIIVTARKRQESILKVPVVANVIAAEQLQQAQITNIEGVTAKVPGLLIGSNVLSIGSQIALRGIGTTALEAGIDQSVSLNIDGQQFSQGLTFMSGLFDLAQAEVLKGPQALFFGKNSPAGVIALTTADPGDEVEIIARASYEFEAREPRTELILSGPLSDTLGVRLAGSWSDSDGYFKNTATAIPGLGGFTLGGRAGGNENWIVRGTVVWNPSSNFRARLKVNFTRDDSENPNGIQYTWCSNGTGPGALGIPFIGGTKPCVQDDQVEWVGSDPAYFGGVDRNGDPALRNGGVPYTIIKQRYGVLELNYDMTPDITATSTTSYYRNVTDTMIGGTYSAPAGSGLFTFNDFYRRDVTQEIRIESDFSDKPLNFLVGGYYQDAKMNAYVYGGGNLAVGLPITLIAGSNNAKIKSKSLFGQLRWKPVEQLEIAGGVRWTNEKRSDKALSSFDFGTTNTYLPVDLITPKISSKNWSPELTITYTPTDDLTIFGALKQGYKSGSFSLTIPAEPDRDNSFGDEKVQGGEAGFKARLLDRALNVNAAFYYYKYKGLQVGVSEPTADGIPITRVVNAGKARTYGIDFDATYRPPAFDGLSLNLSMNWNKAKFTSLNGVPCYAGQTIAMGCDQVFDPTATSPILPGVSGLYTAQDLSGIPLVKAPEWQVVGGFDYEAELTDKLDLVFGSSAQHSSSYLATLSDLPQAYQKSYTKLNGYITLKDSEGRWELSLIGNNINDVIRASNCATSNFQDTTIFSPYATVTGYSTNLTGKITDIGCWVDPGRQVVVKLTLRPMGLFK